MAKKHSKEMIKYRYKKKQMKDKLTTLNTNVYNIEKNSSREDY